MRRLFVANSLGLVILLIGWCVAFAAGWEATWDGFMGSSYDQGRHNMLLLFWVAALATPVAAVTAAALRARHRSLKLPDALVIATAIHLDADHLVTTDRRWPSRSRLGLRGRITEIRASS